MDGVKTFEAERLGRWAPPERCATKSPSGGCPDKAFYAVNREGLAEETYCQRCITTVLFYGTNRGRVVIVRRLETK